MIRAYKWNLDTGRIVPVHDFPAQETPKRDASWEDDLDLTLIDLNDWLSDPINVHDAIAAVENAVIENHSAGTTDNITAYGELGFFVRATNRLNHLEHMLNKGCEDGRAEVWRELAGYAIQALMYHRKNEAGAAKETEKVNIFEIRKNRLIRGFCPDCGEGALLRPHYWENRLKCSERCGFETGDLYSIHMNYPSFNETIEFLASMEAVREQK